jgi:hypothetical protein
VELKDDTLELGDFPFVTPEKWTTPGLDSLDAEIRSVFDPSDLITPDDVRGTHPTLDEAVTTDGWPTLESSRGKVMFLMDNGGGYRSDYLAGHPALAGRVLFTNAEPGDADAAFVKMNNSSDEALIAQRVLAGYVVRTRADSDTDEARTGDTSTRDAALRSGAQWVSTDYPVPGLAVEFTSDYYVQIPGGVVARCNPVNAPPPSCQDDQLERTGMPPSRPEVPTPLDPLVHHAVHRSRRPHLRPHHRDHHHDHRPGTSVHRARYLRPSRARPTGATPRSLGSAGLAPVRRAGLHGLTAPPGRRWELTRSTASTRRSRGWWWPPTPWPASGPWRPTGSPWPRHRALWWFTAGAQATIVVQVVAGWCSVSSCTGATTPTACSSTCSTGSWPCSRWRSSTATGRSSSRTCTCSTAAAGSSWPAWPCGPSR